MYIGIPEEETEIDSETVFKVTIAENFLKLIKDKNPWTQESQRILSRILRHVIVKLQNTIDSGSANFF